MKLKLGIAEPILSAHGIDTKELAEKIEAAVSTKLAGHEVAKGNDRVRLSVGGVRSIVMEVLPQSEWYVLDQITDEVVKWIGEFGKGSHEKHEVVA